MFFDICFRCFLLSFIWFCCLVLGTGLTGIVYHCYLLFCYTYIYVRTLQLMLFCCTQRCEVQTIDLTAVECERFFLGIVGEVEGFGHSVG